MVSDTQPLTVTAFSALVAIAVIAKSRAKVSVRVASFLMISPPAGAYFTMGVRPASWPLFDRDTEGRYPGDRLEGDAMPPLPEFAVGRYFISCSGKTE